MNKQTNDYEIIDMYYADCVQKEDNLPQWSTVRTGQKLTDKESLDKLKKQLLNLQRKKKLTYSFSDEIVKVDHPKNASVRSILQKILKLPCDGKRLEDLEQYGDVLAQKYLKTPYSRTRLFMVIRIKMNDKMSVFTLVADLKDDSFPQIHRDSHDFTSQTIQNLYGDLKKGSVYPGIIDGERNEDAIMIHDAGTAKYYPLSLECMLKKTPEEEITSVVEILKSTCSLSSKQIDQVIEDSRAVRKPTFGTEELGQILTRRGIDMDEEKLNKEWQNQFYYSNYEISPEVFSLDSVSVVIKLDEFEIKFPLNYYPERIEHSEEGGFHYIRLRGHKYQELRFGSSKIRFQ